MSNAKKQRRANVRAATLARDNHRCRRCGYVALSDDELDPHHITPRELMPNGGYVVENIITLCGHCHVQAEAWCVPNEIGAPDPAFAPSALYELIGTTYQDAVAASEKLR